jgi:membrane associated rhomboid family serine protease
MAKCDECGREENMPYTCSHCGNTYCGKHRLPEKHSCPGLEEWNDPKGVFDSGFDDSVDDSGRSFSLFGPGGPLSYFKGNMTFLFLALMFVTWFAQFIVLNYVSEQLYVDLFVLTSTHPEYVWTWVTAIFAHAPPPAFGHIAGNAIVIFFFGRLVEDLVGSRDYTLLFLGTGMLAGLGQIALYLALNPNAVQPTGVLGASGAALAIMGVLTVLAPDLKVYIWFVLPVPIWAITIFYALISSLAILGGTVGAGGVAQGAHLIGLVLGLAYGKYIEGNVRPPQSINMGGGGRGGPGGPGGPGGRRRF